MSTPLSISSEAESKWLNYYEWTSKSNKPWPTLSKAIQSFNEENELDRTAIDVGCGVGKDTAYMVENSWKVTAIDAEKIAEDFLKKKIPPEKINCVNFVQSKYEDYLFSEKVKLVNASYALPFCSPKHLVDVMHRITQAISPGGRFSGHFFGPKDSWSKDDSMSFQTEKEVLQFFADSFIIEHFEEKEWDGMSGSGSKHWHVFDVIAKKV